MDTCRLRRRVIRWATLTGMSLFMTRSRISLPMWSIYLNRSVAPLPSSTAVAMVKMVACSLEASSLKGRAFMNGTG